jgi:hypothetical protein
MINIALLPYVSGYARQLMEQIKSQGKLTVADFETVTIHHAEPPQITQQLPTKQPRRKTGVAQSRRDARKRRNRK